MANLDDPPRAPKGSLRLMIVGFGALLAMLIALASISILSLQHHQTQLNEVVGERMAKVELALAMRKAARERTLGLLRLLLTTDPFELDEEWMHFNRRGAEFADARINLLNMPLSDEEKTLLREQGELTSIAVPLQRQVVALIESNSKEEAVSLLAHDAIPAQNAVIAKVDQFDAIQRNAAETAQHAASTQLEKTRTLILVLGISSVIIGLAVAIAVIRVVRQRGARDAYLATHDPLTGLPNRTLLMDRLEQIIKRNERQEGSLALLFIDIDKFKHINDTYGHAAGDQVLKEAARRIARQLRNSDTLSRLSGDEFVALLDNAADRQAIEASAQRVVDSCAQAVRVAGSDIPLSISVGIALYPEHGRSADELLSHGDTAMYHSKQQGRNRWQIYQGDITTER